MAASETSWKPQLNRSPRHDGAFSQRPAVKATLRALSLVAGLATACSAFVIVGLYAALQYCEGDETQGLCAGHAGLVPFIEWPIFALSVVAPLAGAVASFVTKRPRWLAFGVVVTVVMFALMSVVSTGQTQVSFS